MLFDFVFIVPLPPSFFKPKFLQAFQFLDFFHEFFTSVFLGDLRNIKRLHKFASHNQPQQI